LRQINLLRNWRIQVFEISPTKSYKETERFMAQIGELEMVVMLAVLRLGSDAYGVTIRDELETETSRTPALGTIYKTVGRLEAK
jgi:hypothetical protein